MASAAESTANGEGLSGDPSSIQKELIQDLAGRPPTYPEEVEKALVSCFPSDDPLEKADFDPVEYINQQFPDEDSLVLLESLKKEHEERIVQLEHDINDSIKKQSTTATQAEIDVAETQKAIQELYLKVKEITGKAERSEVMVQEICRDIKQLDYAKRHLTSTITGLKRLHMFITAVDQLEFMTEKRQYREASNLVEAVSQLSIHFKEYSDVPKIRTLRDTVSKLKDQLTKQIFEDFESIQEVSADYAMDGEDASLYYASDAQTPESLAGACAVASALGTACRQKLCRMMCDTWLKAYEAEFGPNAAHAGLENTERRFSWLRRTLVQNQEQYSSIFPDAWAIDYQLVVEFFLCSAKHLKTVLSRVEPPESLDSVLLTRALKQSLAFEQEMFSRFESPLGPKAPPRPIRRSASVETQQTELEDGPEGEVQYDEDGRALEPMSVAAIKQRHQARRESHGGEAPGEPGRGGSLINTESDVAKRARELEEELRALPTIKGLLSGVFEPYLISHVKQLSQDIVKSLREQVKAETEGGESALTVLPSSTLLLSKFKSAMKHFVTLTRGQGFFDLYKEFKVCFKTYTGILTARVATLNKAKTPSGPSAEALCFILNSAEYLSTAIPALENALRNAIDPAFREAIDLSPESAQFQKVTTAALRALVHGLEKRFDKALNAMIRTNWLQFGAVGDQSDYVIEFGRAVAEYMPPARRLLEPVFFHKLCGDFTASTALPKFLNSLIRCKQIGDVGAQQLLIDAYSLKSVFLGIPTVGSQEAEADPPLELRLYETWVNNFMHTCELFLKLVGMNVSQADVVRNFPVLLEEGNLDDLKLVLELRGVKKTEMGPLLQLAKESGVSAEGKGVLQVNLAAQSAGNGGIAAAVAGSLNARTARDAASNMNFSIPNISTSKNKLDLLNAMSTMFENTSTSFQNYTKRATT